MGRCVCRVCARIKRICEKGSRNSQGPKGKQALVDRCGQRANGKSNRSCESNPQSREGQERRAGGAGAASADASGADVVPEEGATRRAAPK